MAWMLWHLKETVDSGEVKIIPLNEGTPNMLST